MFVCMYVFVCIWYICICMYVHEAGLAFCATLSMMKLIIYNITNTASNNYINIPLGDTFMKQLVFPVASVILTAVS